MATLDHRVEHRQTSYSNTVDRVAQTSTCKHTNTRFEFDFLYFSCTICLENQTTLTFPASYNPNAAQ